ncbi:hypothetical protein SELMODRAFT_439861 [Selaginella moellendorffii]|uniref:Uncharacterized protein n=1 Tax=Selaginella moellendorffii TaxID=88036 RepID=D8R7V1_SELML|nr:uncharacterized protein LOC9631873 [Selaginella moellendorffii]EFJ31596.1 hypothetical protein SELMODRAFT_439861 [Selaginella moellendorffii]|eukprot:XP_002966997.1 uncharacterized protein LOC9631873 [Selaginella moellendorffii]
MGGGILLRGVAKAVTRPPIVGLAAVAAAATSSSVPQSVMMGSASASSAAALPLRAAVADDWVFAGDEERSEYFVRDHLVFGAAPSRDEVEEATADLQNALGMCFGEGLPTPALQQDSPVSSIRGPSSVHLGHPVVDWIEPHLVSHEPGNVQVCRRNEVAEAFSLLQNDPIVQGVVMSVASDKAVWDAVLANEKVKEFRKKLQENGYESFVAGDGEVIQEGGKHTRPSDQPNPNLVDFLAQLLDYSKNAYLRVKRMLTELLSSFLDNKFFSTKDGNFADPAIKSCFMLSLVVLSVVLLKRASAA